MGIISDILNYASVRQTNAQNEALTREAWARDDNAVQRRKADLLAAGMNPILAAGDAAANSQPIQKQAPEFNSDPLGEVINMVGQGMSMANAIQDYRAQALAMEQAQGRYQMEQANHTFDMLKRLQDYQLGNYMLNKYYPALTKNYNAGASWYSAQAGNLSFDTGFKQDVKDTFGINLPNNMPTSVLLPIMYMQYLKSGAGHFLKNASDWGTGLPSVQDLSNSVESFIEKASKAVEKGMTGYDQFDQNFNKTRQGNRF